MRRYVQAAAGLVFGLSLAALLVFWTVKNTKPAGSAVFPVLYGILGASALIWLVAEFLRRGPLRAKPPKLQITTGDGPEFRVRSLPKDNLAAEMKTSLDAGVPPDHIPVEQFTWVLKAAETNHVWAKEVRARVVESDPPPAPGTGSLPGALPWHGAGTPEVIDIPPGGRAYVEVLQMVRFDPGDGAEDGGGWGLVIPEGGWAVGDKMAFTVELFNAEGSLGRAQFSLDKAMEPNSEGVILFPTITEL
jgi:hypothetical protein